MDENDVSIRERLVRLEVDLDNEIEERKKLSTIIDEMRDIVVEMKHMRADLNSISTEVAEIKNRPAKHWESIISAGISAIVGGGLGFLISHLIGG